MTRRPRAAALAALVAAPLLLAGCSGDPVEDYCAAVAEHQQRLSEIAGEGGPAALLEALDVFRDLQRRAPSDLADEWALVVRRLEVLREALDDAGVDPAAYDAADPPAGLGADQRARIEAAARELGSPATAAALEGIEQQARDVCKTPLTV